MTRRSAPRQGDLFLLGDAPHFDGETFDPTLDAERLARQLGLVRAVMADGRWHSLHDVSQRTGAPEASVSARLRDLRKERFGAWRVERRRMPETSGRYEYRLTEPNNHGGR